VLLVSTALGVNIRLQKMIALLVPTALGVNIRLQKMIALLVPTVLKSKPSLAEKLCAVGIVVEFKLPTTTFFTKKVLGVKAIIIRLQEIL
jgi:hypothetical protein